MSSLYTLLLRSRATKNPSCFLLNYEHNLYPDRSSQPEQGRPLLMGSKSSPGIAPFIYRLFASLTSVWLAHGEKLSQHNVAVGSSVGRFGIHSCDWRCRVRNPLRAVTCIACCAPAYLFTPIDYTHWLRFSITINLVSGYAIYKHEYLPNLPPLYLSLHCSENERERVMSFEMHQMCRFEP
jgi:hypothetical protein